MHFKSNLPNPASVWTEHLNEGAKLNFLWFLIGYVYMDIGNLIIYLILYKTILWLRGLHELLLE